MIIEPDFEIENKLRLEGFDIIAGVDEVGAGCLAGPVVAGAVILPEDLEIENLRDSKKLSSKQREKISVQIKEKAVVWAIGSATVEEIDAVNIRQADFLAMRRALDALNSNYGAVIVDGFLIPDLACRQIAITKGDQKSKSIAAASIVAKVYRDEMMREYEKEFPGYGFAKHKGYGTADHLAALQKLGACSIHRQSYAPVKNVIYERI